MRTKIIYYYYAACAATTIAGILHLTIVFDLLGRNPNTGIFFLRAGATQLFLIAGIAQLFWTIPMIKRWDKLWYYLGIAGTILLMIIFFTTRLPNSITNIGLPITNIGMAVEIFESIYIGITAFIIVTSSDNLNIDSDSKSKMIKDNKSK